MSHHGIRPIDIPALRAELAAHLSNPRAVPMWEYYADEIGFGGYSPKASKGQGPGFMRLEHDRVTLAELFYVSEGMGHLAETAGKTMPVLHLAREDLPADYGLMMFDSPVDSWGADGDPRVIPVHVCIWGLLPGEDRLNIRHGPDEEPLPEQYRTAGGVWFSFYTLRESDVAESVRHGYYDEDHAAAVRELMPRLIYDNEYVQFFGESHLHDLAPSAGNIVDAYGRTVRAAMQLMQQPIVSVKEAHYDRHTRRRLARDGIPATAVRVISLRRAASGYDPEHSGREYRHQWIVRGHWRKQWYATVQDHRPIWVAPHIKGPEGAPLLGGEKVYAWTR